MTDWQMVVESFPDGRQTFPRLTGPPRPPRTGPRLVVTTHAVRARASRRAGVQRLRIGLARGRAQPRRDGRPRPASIAARCDFSDGTIVIQKYEPMTADMTARFKFVDGKIVLDRIDLVTDGAVSDMTGVVDLSELARAALSDQVDDPVSEAARDLLRARQVHAVRRRPLHRHVPHVQGRPRAEGRFHQRAGRRQRLSLSESRGLAGLGARSDGGDARHRGFLRRQGRLQVPDGAARQEAISRRARCSTSTIATSISTR